MRGMEQGGWRKGPGVESTSFRTQVKALFESPET